MYHVVRSQGRLDTSIGQPPAPMWFGCRIVWMLGKASSMQSRPKVNMFDNINGQSPRSQSDSEVDKNRGVNMPD